MFSILSLLLSLSLCASAGLISRQTQTPCSFVMNAVGSVNGSVVEDHVGESRIGGTYPQGNYYLLNGTLYDSLNHNCIIQTGSRQLQCTAGARGAPTTFSFADDGNLLANGTENWLACTAEGPGNDGSYNIFSGDKEATDCNAITLRTGGFNCTALGTPSSSSSTSTAVLASAVPTSISSASTPPSGVYYNTGSSSASTSTPTSGTLSNSSSAITNSTPACPTDISNGTYQFPHLIVPVSPNASDHSFGNQFSASVSPINTTLFNFDIPVGAPYNGSCTLLFLFPFGGATYFSGIEEEEGEMGGLDFALLQQVATANTTYNTMGGVETDYGKTEILPGNNYTVATFNCQESDRVSYAVSSKGNVELDYFQEVGDNPIGLYIVPCA